FRLWLELWSWRNRRQARVLDSKRIGAVLGERCLMDSRYWIAPPGGPFSQVGCFQGEGLLGLASSASFAAGPRLDRRMVPRFPSGNRSWTLYSSANRAV